MIGDSQQPLQYTRKNQIVLKIEIQLRKKRLKMVKNTFFPVKYRQESVMPNLFFHQS